jgi:hypothetical protein
VTASVVVKVGGEAIEGWLGHVALMTLELGSTVALVNYVVVTLWKRTLVGPLIKWLLDFFWPGGGDDDDGGPGDGPPDGHDRHVKQPGEGGAGPSGGGRLDASRFRPAQPLPGEPLGRAGESVVFGAIAMIVVLSLAASNILFYTDNSAQFALDTAALWVFGRIALVYYSFLENAIGARARRKAEEEVRRNTGLPLT